MKLYIYKISATVIIMILIFACVSQVGTVVINKPDEYRHIYEAKEEIVLKAIAGIFRDKQMGRNVIVNKEERSVKTDYIIQGDWRTKSKARVKMLNWKECEVVISVVTEKKTETGWEMRRLLEKKQYENLFDTIELRIYEEMAKIE